ncbi:hypothetical protein GCM10010109_36970 [Actinoplanes campanulatus]|nr:hypothetical protein GCM10010109_36970 [Actinoplanes campanulatus]GID34557.1 hypothetical protein Aca09nite_10630 [Actinoplanes campanulatus]
MVQAGRRDRHSRMVQAGRRDRRGRVAQAGRHRFGGAVATEAAELLGVAALETENATPLLRATEILPLGRMVTRFRRVAHLRYMRPAEQRPLPHR